MGSQGLDPKDLTAGVADIEAARIALRWALERIRALEEAARAAPRPSGEEAPELAEAKRAMQAAQRDLERRERALALREGFLADMRRLLDGGEAGQAARLKAAEERERLESELARARDLAMRQVAAAAAAAEDALDSEKRRLAEVEHGFQSALEEPLRLQAEALGAEHRRELADLRRTAEEAQAAFAAAAAERDARLEDLGRRLDEAARRAEALEAAHAADLESAAQRARAGENALRSELEGARAEAAGLLASAQDRLVVAQARWDEERAAAAEALRGAEELRSADVARLEQARAGLEARLAASEAAEGRGAEEARALREALARLEGRLADERAAAAERLREGEERRAAEVARLEEVCRGAEVRLARAEAEVRAADERWRAEADLRGRFEVRAAEGEAAVRAVVAERSRLDAAAAVAESRRTAEEAAARAEVLEARRREGEALGAAWKAQTESAERLGAAEARRAEESSAARAEIRRLEDSAARLEARLAEAEAAARAAVEEARRREAAALESLARAGAESAERQAAAEARRAAEADRAQAELRRLETACARLEERLLRRDAVEPATTPAPATPAPAAPATAGFGRRPVLGLLAAGALAVAAFASVRPLGREHILPTSHASALVWDSGLLWVADWHDGVIHVLAPSASGLRSQRRYALDKTSPVGLAVGRDRIFVSDAWTRRIERRRKDDALTLESSVPSPGPKPSGLFFDGKYLWSADQALGRVYQHADDESLTVLGEFSAGHAPVGLYSGPKGFWTFDAKDAGFFRLQPPPSMAVVESYRLRELSEDARPFSAFTWGGNRLWVARDGSATLLERPAWLLSERR